MRILFLNLKFTAISEAQWNLATQLFSNKNNLTLLTMETDCSCSQAVAIRHFSDALCEKAVQEKLRLVREQGSEFIRRACERQSSLENAWLVSTFKWIICDRLNYRFISYLILHDVILSENPERICVFNGEESYFDPKWLRCLLEITGIPFTIINGTKPDRRGRRSVWKVVLEWLSLTPYSIRCLVYNLRSFISPSNFGKTKSVLAVAYNLPGGNLVITELEALRSHAEVHYAFISMRLFQVFTHLPRLLTRTKGRLLLDFRPFVFAALRAFKEPDFVGYGCESVFSHRGVSIWKLVKMALAGERGRIHLARACRFLFTWRSRLVKAKPSLIVIPSLLYPENQILQKICHELGIQTVILPVHFDPIFRDTEMILNYSPPPLVLAPTSYFRETLLQAGHTQSLIQPICLQKDLTILQAASPKTAATQIGFFETIKDSGYKGYFLFTAQGFDFEPETLRTLARAMHEFSDWLLLVRPHPMASQSIFLPEMTRNILLSQNLELVDLIQHATVFLTFTSQTAYDAVMMNKDVILVNVTRDYYQYDLIRQKVAIEARNTESLITVLRELTSQDSKLKEQLSDARQRYHQRFGAIPMDSSASKVLHTYLSQTQMNT